VFILLFINSNNQPCSQTINWTFDAPAYPIAYMKISKDDQSLVYSIRSTINNLITNTAFKFNLETTPKSGNFGSG
jgi:hypothetical protein